MEIKYEIKGITLDVYDLMELHHYYEAACTAEYLMENYTYQIGPWRRENEMAELNLSACKSDEKIALRLGYEVRKLMDKYGYDEEEAINKVLRDTLSKDDIYTDLRMEQLEQM